MTNGGGRKLSAVRRLVNSGEMNLRRFYNPRLGVIACAAMFCSLRVVGDGTITGHVRETTGAGISGAEVRVSRGERLAITDATGSFRIRQLPSGVARLTVRRLGFRPATRELAITDGATAELTVELEALAMQLQQVTVSERTVSADPRLASFRDRMQKRPGHFYTRDRIESIAPTDLSELLRGIPGVRVGPIRGTAMRTSVRFRGAVCAPIVVVDGFVAGAAEFDLDTVDPATVEALEVYMDASSAPTEIMGPRFSDRCGVIVIWTRHLKEIRRHSEKAALQGELQQQVDGASLFAAQDVDSVARIVAATFTPVYPDALWTSALEGYARVEFVVDADGELEGKYVSVVSASNPAFGESVKAALEKATFVAAVRSGKRVRQVMQIPVRFARPNR